MVLELHVWGPAFGLPSIDAECLGTIAYFHRIIPWPQWVLISDFNPSSSPNHEFPFLVDGDAKVAGFENIVLYLRNHRSGAYDLDYNLTHQQQMDRVAFISFLHSTADPLVDLHLYISSENYSGITKSAYTAILPWYTNYTIPPRRRALARTRTTHLGLNGLDVDTANEGDTEIGGASLNREYEAAKKAAGLPSDSKASQPRILQMGRGKGLSGLLSSPLYAARFKLDALINELLEPLSELLGKKDYLFEGDKPSSLDCLAFGYLALMFYPQAPQAWLKEAMQTRYPRILRYIGRMREVVLGKEDVNPSDVWSITSSADNDEETGVSVRRLGMRLPWRPRRSPAISSAAVTATQEIISSLPFLSSLSRPVTHNTSGRPLHDKEPASHLPSPLVVKSVWGFSTACAAVLAGMAIHHRQHPHEGDQVFSALRPVMGWRGYGEAGDVLSVLAGRL
jgi:sorting and assembly machinery component 37